MTSIEYMKTPVYSKEDRSAIDCILKLAAFDFEIPFTASLDDVEPHGAAIYQALLAGEAGPIGAYVPPPEPIVPVRVPNPDTTAPVVL